MRNDLVSALYSYLGYSPPQSSPCIWLGKLTRRHSPPLVSQPSCPPSFAGSTRTIRCTDAVSREGAPRRVERRKDPGGGQTQSSTATRPAV